MIIFSGPKERLLEIALVPENLELFVCRECQGSGAERRENRTRFTCVRGTEVTQGERENLPIKKIKVAGDVCDLYEGNHKAVIFRKMKVDEQKERHAVLLDGKAVHYKMPIFLKLIYSIIGAHIQPLNRIFFFTLTK